MNLIAGVLVKKVLFVSSAVIKNIFKNKYLHNNHMRTIRARG